MGKGWEGLRRPEGQWAPHWMRDVEEGEVEVENIIEVRKRSVNVRYYMKSTYTFELFILVTSKSV